MHPSGLLPARALALAGLLLAVAVPAPAADYTWTNPAGGSWNTPENWSGGIVPGEADSATVALSGAYNVMLPGGTTKVGSVILDNAGLTVNHNSNSTRFEVGGAFTLRAGSYTPSAGTLQVGGPLTTSAGTIFNLVGAVEGTGAATFNGTLLWSDGGFGGSGAVTINTPVAPTGTHRWSVNGTRQVVLNGGGTWKGGSLDVNRDARFVIPAGATLTHTGEVGPSAVGAGGFGGGTFDIEGTFRSQGTAINYVLFSGAGVSGGPSINNRGLIETTSGKTEFNTGGTHTGEFRTAAGATLVFTGGTTDLNAGARFTGAGDFRTTAGNMRLNAAVPAENYTAVGGFIEGTGTLTVTNQFTWSGASVGGSATVNVTGRTTMPAGGTPSVRGNGLAVLTGPATWDSGSLWLLDSGTLRVPAGSTLVNTTASGDAGVTYGGTFDNRGTFRKEGTGKTTFTNLPTLLNSGTIDVANGTLEIGGPFVNTGLLHSRSGTVWLNAWTGTHSGELRADGNLYFGGGNHNLNAGTSLTGNQGVAVAGGAVRVNVPLTAARFAMSALGGSLHGPEQLTVTSYFQLRGGSVWGRVNATGSTDVAGGVIESGGVVTLAGTAGWSGGISVRGGGTLRVLGAATGTGSALSVSGLVEVPAGGAVRVSQATISGGRLHGAGTVTGPVTVRWGGVLAASGGNLTVVGSATAPVTLEGGSADMIPFLGVEATRTGPGAATVNRVAVTGTGAIDVVNVGGGSRFGIEVRGATLAWGESYTITVATANGGILKDGVAVGPNYTFAPADYVVTSPNFPAVSDVSLVTTDANTLVLRFTPVPEPGAVLAASAAGLLAVARLRRRRYQAVTRTC